MNTISDLIISKEELKMNFFKKNHELIEEFTMLVNNIIFILLEKEEFSCVFGKNSKINDIKYKSIRTIVISEYIKKGYNFNYSTDAFIYIKNENGETYVRDRTIIGHLEFNFHI